MKRLLIEFIFVIFLLTSPFSGAAPLRLGWPDFAPAERDIREDGMTPLTPQQWGELAFYVDALAECVRTRDFGTVAYPFLQRRAIPGKPFASELSLIRVSPPVCSSGFMLSMNRITKQNTSFAMFAPKFRVAPCRQNAKRSMRKHGDSVSAIVRR
ncbi:MAG: hypothetical protein LBR07_09860 [Puniceicoccales bacterium]|nr:hypothetical protein [Puniceicoccales bacterium]